MTKTETATRYMENIARDDSHGYDQIHRMGPFDFDCSGLNITGWVKAGVPVNKAVKNTVTVNGKQKTVTTPGATYTGNIRNAYLKHGFKDVTKSVDLVSGRGLKRGDVLLREGHHVAQYCGNGREVEASINEKGTTTGGKQGDQTGREILIRNYRNYPWNCVLRYQEKADTTKPTKADNDLDKIAKEVIAGKWGTGDTRRIKLSSAGYDYKKVQARVNKLLKG